MEIERKFLIKYLPDLSSAVKRVIEQGYLNRAPVVRIRKSNEDYILTCKSKTGHNQENAIQNEEIEMPLTEEAYLHLKEKIDGSLVEKIRYELPLPQGQKAELDVFKGQMEGLVFVEVEFESEADAMAFQAPDWFGDDVSRDHHFSNAYLSEVGDYQTWKQKREQRD